jgi:hypothetical protein
MGGSRRLSVETGGRREGEKPSGEPTPFRPVSLHCRIQAHPSRRDIRDRLVSRLDMPFTVVETAFDPPSPWGGYLACLEEPPSSCTHLLVIQDDAIPARNLTPALGKMLQAEPDVPVCLYLGGLPLRTRGAALQAGKAGRRFVEVHLGDFMPVVAVVWPRPLAVAFREWGTDPSRLRQRNGRTFVERSDDSMAGRWMRQTRQRVVATIPSLVEHPDDVVSTIARTNSGRTALFWHGVDWDASSVEW